MKRFTQIFGTISLAAILFVVFAFVLTSGENGLSSLRSVTEKSEDGSVNFSAYSKMARLSISEPDERLAMPVKGVRTNQIADTWGAARSGGRSHSGQDIFAKRGTPVYSATNGYILRVGETNLGGKSVFIYGAGGRRYYYAHLDDFAPDLKAGDYVTTSSLLGFVGTTGNAKNTPPHLHFGVYGTGGAINPLTLLTDRT
ncbi:MAG TPA: M23 family metallopeptidase [Pyrinomonadaceae bacterium]|nr:M23 family metallopeptidase [Pyrinomonadaceae bacterium]